MLALIQSHGGVVLLVAIAIFNIVMSAIAQIFGALHQKPPGWVQTVGTWGLRISQWLSGNTPTPPSP